MYASINTRVQRTLDSLIASGQEAGLQVAACIGDDLVVDAWSGVADEVTGRLVNGETLFPCWSTTKGVAATCIHLLADRGLASYDAHVATIWPEFAEGGKSSVTLRQVLAHTSGVPQMPEAADLAMVSDWHAMCRYIAQQTPLWEPGHVVGYHAWTYGWIVGELVRRIDGRTIADFVRSEFNEGWKVGELYLGIPDTVVPRVATLRSDITAPVASTELHARALPPQITRAEVANLPAFRRASLPAVGGIATARALARHYAVLANDGMVGNKRVLSSRRIEEMRKCQTDEVDRVLGLRIRRSLGYSLGGNDSNYGDERMNGSPGAFGHPGMGGSIAFADPLRRFSFALTKTLLKGAENRTASAAFKVVQEIRSAMSWDKAAGL